MAVAVAVRPAHLAAAGHVADEAVSAYIDGALPADEALAVAEHLRGCVPCAAVVQAHRRVGVQVRSLAVQPVPPAVLQAARRLPWQ